MHGLARPSNQNREARLFVRKREIDERVKRCSPDPDALKLGDLPAKLEDGYISIFQSQRQFVLGMHIVPRNENEFAI